MDENAHRSWDIRLRTAGVVALIAAGVFGLWKYSTDLSASFKQPFYIQQMDTYMEMAKVVSNIAVSSSYDERQEMSAKFWRLYYGKMVLVEDSDVVDSMKDFGQCLIKGCGEEELREKALLLTKAARHSIGNAWAKDTGWLAAVNGIEPLRPNDK